MNVWPHVFNLVPKIIIAVNETVPVFSFKLDFSSIEPFAFHCMSLLAALHARCSRSFCALNPIALERNIEGVREAR